MTSLIISFLIVLVVPLLMASWRTSLIGLSLQGLLMGSMVLQRGFEPSLAGVVSLVDLYLVRGLIVPWILWRILARHRVAARNDVIPPNLLSWLLMGALIVVAFRFGRAMSPAEPHAATQVAVAAAAVLLGFFVLATQNSPFSQIVGVLRIENGIALLALVPPEHRFPAPIELGLALLFPLTLFTLSGFLGHFTSAAPPAPPREPL